MPIRLILALFGLAIAQPAFAQQQEPPSRVGAVGYVSGNIAFHMAGETQWSAAGVNYPVATGGSFWTDPQSRAELQIGPSTIDMAGGTEIDVTNLNEQVAQIGIPEGRLYLHLRQLDAGQSFEIDLPQGAVWLLQPGSYDIDAGTTGEPARVAVFAGDARFVGNGIDSGIKAGDAVVLSGSNPVSAQVAPVAPDAFVEWCRGRDYHQNQVAMAARYVSPQMTGYADLDQYGGWQNSPQYGEVWYPSQVPADWAPYRDGRWIWVQPWGWTWVDQEPWGFAPFHYGRWAYAGDRWGWIPGQYVAQPVYAPALVAFVGAAVSGFAVSGGGGPAVGWFPLAPNEPYWPSYTRNANYIRNVNIANVKNIDTIVVHSNGVPPAQVENTNFANRRFATVVPQRVFANADPVARAAIHVTPAALEKAPVVLASARDPTGGESARGRGAGSREYTPGGKGSRDPAPGPSGIGGIGFAGNTSAGDTTGAWPWAGSPGRCGEPCRHPAASRCGQPNRARRQCPRSPGSGESARTAATRGSASGRAAQYRSAAAVTPGNASAGCQRRAPRAASTARCGAASPAAGAGTSLSSAEAGRHPPGPGRHPSAGAGFGSPGSGRHPSAGAGRHPPGPGRHPSAGADHHPPGSGRHPSAGADRHPPGPGGRPPTGAGFGPPGSGRRPPTGAGCRSSGSGRRPPTGAGCRSSGSGRRPSTGAGCCPPATGTTASADRSASSSGTCASICRWRRQAGAEGPGERRRQTPVA